MVVSACSRHCRAYGEWRCADGGDIDDARRAHAVAFRSKAVALEQRTLGPDDAAVFDAIVAQLPDYDAAITWCLDHDDPESALEMSLALHECMTHRQLQPLAALNSIARLLTEMSWDEPHLGWVRPIRTHAEVAGLDFAAGWTYAMTSDQERARILAARAVELDPDNSFAHAILSHTAVILGVPDLALAPARAALETARTPTRHFSAAMCLGYALHATGARDQAACGRDAAPRVGGRTTFTRRHGLGLPTHRDDRIRRRASPRVGAPGGGERDRGSVEMRRRRALPAAPAPQAPGRTRAR